MESSWRDLQDLHIFAPARPQFLSRNASNLSCYFEFWKMSSPILSTFVSIQCSMLTNFVRISRHFPENRSDVNMEICRNLPNLAKISRHFRNRMKLIFHFQVIISSASWLPALKQLSRIFRRVKTSTACLILIIFRQVSIARYLTDVLRKEMKAETIVERVRAEATESDRRHT